MHTKTQNLTLSTFATRTLTRGLALGSLLFCLAAPSQAATLDVCSSGCSYSTVASAVSAASAGDVIELGPGTYNEGGIYIGKSLTLRSSGSRATIDAGSSSYVFFVGAGKVVSFEDLILQGGTQCRLDNRGITYLSTVSVRGLGAVSQYGGIHNAPGGVLTIQDSSDLSTNVSPFYGGGISNFGDLTFLNSTAIGNTGADGGAIFNGGGTVSVLSSSLSSNHAIKRGGAWANVSGTFAFHGSSSYSGNTAMVACDKFWNPGATPDCVN